MSTTKLSRAELHAQVWTTPMSRLAAEYGVSDVALAKTCKRMNVPTPGRGYWARLAAGAKLKPTPLPKAQPGTDESVLLRLVENPLPPAPRRERPEVLVPRNLRRAGELTREVGGALGKASTDEHGRLLVKGVNQPVIAVSVATHRRALLLLDGLAKGFRIRGHALTFREEGESFGMIAGVNGESIGLSIEERLDRKDHELTPEEHERVAKGYRWGIPKYDYFAGGRLQLTLHGGGVRGSWSDTKTRRLDQELGAIIIAAEDEAERRKQQRLADEERRRQEELRRLEREEEQRREREREARAKYAAALVTDLKEMARRWSEAHQVDAFVRAVRSAVPEGERPEGLDAWLEWAAAQARSMDPLAQPRDIAKKLEPDLSR